jgi:hypothetical protein
MKFTINDLNDLKFNQVLTQNEKMRKTSKKEKIRLFNFGISAFKSHSTAAVTCPFAKDCIKYCYARKGSFIWNKTKIAYEKRYLLTKNPNLFKAKITEAINRRKATHIRIHDSGDFYNRDYILQWFEIMREFPEVIFYAYTKSKMLFDEFNFLPPNFTVIYSLGSRFDNLIDQEIDRHSKIFESESDLLNAGYINASKNDLNAIHTSTNKIGLLIH